MGLSASQGKLLVLTARKSDLEFRAQVIANRKLLLTAQTENIAMEYTRKLGNRQMSFIYNFDANQNTGINEILSIDSILSQNAAFVGTWRVVLADGRIAVPDASYIPGIAYDVNTGYAQSGYSSYTPDSSQILATFNSLSESTQMLYLANGLNTLCNDYQNLDATVRNYLDGEVTSSGHEITKCANIADNLLSSIYGSSIPRSNDLTDAQAKNVLSNTQTGSDLRALVRTLSKDIFGNETLVASPSTDEQYADYTKAINKLNAFYNVNSFLETFNDDKFEYNSTARDKKDDDGNYTGFTEAMADKLSDAQKDLIKKYYKNLMGSELAPASGATEISKAQYAEAMNKLNKFYKDNSAKLEQKYDASKLEKLSDDETTISRLNYLKSISEAYTKEASENNGSVTSGDAYDAMKKFLNSNKNLAAQMAYMGCGAFRSMFVSGQVTAQDPANDGSQNIIVNNADGSKDQYIIIPGLKNSYFFQNALREGSIFLQKFEPSQNDPTVGEWQRKDWSATGLIQDKLYTEDDAAAEAEYETQMAIIQRQDKELDVELKQVETQQKACENEIDAVKKVIEKNGEKSFKYFS